MTQLWTEKHRPQSFSEIRGQKEIIKRIKSLVEQKNIPHLLFAGPAGTGKTTTALIIAKELFKEHLQENFLELNASDDRGIDTVRVKIKDFARTKSIKEIPFKIILLDECDSLTKDAQQALRRTMETYSNTCRFILSCNQSSKIMEPIQSRCAVFRFKPLTKEDIGEIIDEIIKNEGLKINKDIYNLLYEVSEGDTRRLQNILQSSATLSNEITEDTIYESISLVKPKEIKNIIELALNKKFIESRNLLLNTMLNNGLSGLDIIKQILKEIDSLKIPDEKRLDLIDKCGEIEFRITEGADEYIQLECLLANFAK